MSDPTAVRRAGYNLIERRGWSVFLVNVADGRKIPFASCDECPAHGVAHDAEACDHLLCHGFYAATRDHARFDLMCDARPEGVLAVRTGVVSGIVVIDAESRADVGEVRTGVETIEQWEILFDWELPATLAQRTASGGVHLYYAYPEDDARVRSHNRVLPAIDIKAEPGYVVVPPAPGRSWINPDVPIASLSPELRAWLLTARGRRSRVSANGNGNGNGDDPDHDRPDGYDFNRFLVEGAPVGCRDEFFNELAFRLRKRGVDHAVAVGRVTEAWHRSGKSAGVPSRLADALEKVDRVWETVAIDDVEMMTAPADEPAAIVVASPDDAARVAPYDPATDVLEDDAGDASSDARVASRTAGITVSGEVATENATDLGNALRLVRLAGDQVRYAADEGRWYVWDGQRWVVDLKGLQALELTKVVVDDLVSEARSRFGDDGRAWRAWATQAESISRRQAMLASAQAEPSVRTTVDAFDLDPWLLVCRNGTLDLRACVMTGSCVVRPGRREDLCTHMADVTFDPTAPAMLWRRHVDVVANGDAILGAYLRRIAGYSLTGSTSEQAFFFLEGSGANGKNAFVEPLIKVMGSYATVGTSALLTGGDEQHPTIFADLLGRRLVFVDETRQGRPLNVERIKSLTGSERIKARRMREDFFEFKSRAKLWIAGNDHPTIRDPSDGVWRRMHRIMCEAKISDAARVKDYGQLLFEQEAAGILNWAVEGLRDVAVLGGLDAPASVTDAVAEYRDEEDVVGQFVDECLTMTGDPADRLSNAELYAAFVMWSVAAGFPNRDRPTRTHFGRRLASTLIGRAERFMARVDGKVSRGFVGIKITSVS